MNAIATNSDERNPGYHRLDGRRWFQATLRAAGSVAALLKVRAAEACPTEIPPGRPTLVRYSERGTCSVAPSTKSARVASMPSVVEWIGYNAHGVQRCPQGHAVPGQRPPAARRVRGFDRPVDQLATELILPTI
jgi:hypothetical protein